MRYKLILLFLLLIVGCGTYKTQYYLHNTTSIPINIIDSINRVHDINVPLSFDKMSKTILPTDSSAYIMYHYAEFKGDTLYILSITSPSDESKYIVKLRKELNK